MTQSYFAMIKIDNPYADLEFFQVAFDMRFISEKLVAFGGIIVDSGSVKVVAGRLGCC